MASDSTSNNFYMGSEIQNIPSATNGQHYYSNVLAPSHNDAVHHQNNNNQHNSGHPNLIENRNNVDAINASAGTNNAGNSLPQHNINNRWTGPPPTALQSANEIADRYHQNGGTYNHYPNGRNPWCFNNIPQGYQRLYADNCGNFPSNVAQNQSQIIEQSGFAKHNFGFQQRGAFILIEM